VTKKTDKYDELLDRLEKSVDSKQTTIAAALARAFMAGAEYQESMILQGTEKEEGLTK
jgi:hypothetical protein